jgi:hypothetical protein
MKRLVSALILVLGALACSSHSGPPPPPPVLVPPQIDLKQREVIGVIEFKSAGKTPLGPLATRKFTEMARRDQGLVRIVPLGSEGEVLHATGAGKLDPAALVAVGKQRDVQTILVGVVTVDNVKPNVRVATDLSAAGVTAQVRATLDVQLIEAATGASLWNATASATESLGHLDVVGGRNVAFDAGDSERVYGGLVNELVERTTRPFRASWERR